MTGARGLAASLLARAEDDAAAATALLPVGDVSDAIGGFHAQRPRLRASSPMCAPGTA
jgi:hypothetical protein